MPETGLKTHARRAQRGPLARPALTPSQTARSMALSSARTADIARCRLATRLAAYRFEVSRTAILRRGRGSRQSSAARQVAMYLAHVALGVPVGEAAKQFRRDRSTALFACRQVEDRRDDPAFDVALADLELAARILFDGEGKAEAA